MLARWSALAAVAVAAALGFACRAGHVASPTGALGAGERAPSNALRGDYAGSAACARCHGSVYSAWTRAPMHRMTRLADTAEIHAPFTDPPTVFRFKEDSAAFRLAGGARTVAIHSARYGDKAYR